MMTDKDVRQWYDANGLEYLEDDWGLRAENGESASAQTTARDRVGREHVAPYDPHSLTRLENEPDVELSFLWEQREDHEVLAAIEEFFAPYISLMPAAKRRVLDEYLLARRTQADIADDMGVTQQAVSKQLSSAVRWLVREVAREQRLLTGAFERAESDTELAWQAFNEFWLDRFGTEWPLRGE